MPSHVDEDALVARTELERGHALSPAEMVLLLARAKAEAVLTDEMDGLVLGGDSAFVLDDVTYGKPHRAEVARERWVNQRGRTGELFSGHWVIRVSHGAVIDAIGEVAVASVTFAADISDAEIEAYIATGEPLAVAGAFTIDSRGGPFIERIDGDPSTVIGVSLPTLRRLSGKLGVFWPDLWNVE